MVQNPVLLPSLQGGDEGLFSIGLDVFPKGPHTGLFQHGVAAGIFPALPAALFSASLTAGTAFAPVLFLAAVVPAACAAHVFTAHAAGQPAVGQTL